MTYSLSQYFESPQEIEEGKKTYVLDTSVLLSDPKAIHRFEDNHVVVPITVIRELEKKRTDIEIGYFARKALHEIESLRRSNGSLNDVLYLDTGGSFAVSVDLPETYKNNDEAILFAATEIQASETRPVVVVSKDLPMRILASIAGLETEEYRAEIKSTEEWSGMETIEVDIKVLDKLYSEGVVTLEDQQYDKLPVNTGIILKCGTSSALAVYLGQATFQIIDETEVFGVAGRSAEQKIAISHLLAKDVGIVSMGGRAGTGKSALALLAGLEGVLEQQEYKKIMVFKPLYAVGGQELGYLPGDQQEKMNPWAASVFDALEPLVSKNVMDEVIARNLIEVLPLTHIRGRSLHDSFVIVDEAQSLERNVILTVLSRLGKNSKVVLTHDVAQRDNLRVGRYDGITSVVEALKGNQLFAHITLRKSERSAIAELVTNLLDF